MKSKLIPRVMGWLKEYLVSYGFVKFDVSMGKTSSNSPGELDRHFWSSDNCRPWMTARLLPRKKKNEMKQNKTDEKRSR